jgi:hypothetical protein
VSVRATPYRNLRAVVCVGRLPDPTTVFAGPALLANVCNQSEHEALAARCLATWPSLIREGGGEGKRYDRSLVEAGDAVVIAALPLRLVPWSGEPCEQAKVDGTWMAHDMSV